MTKRVTSEKKKDLNAEDAKRAKEKPNLNQLLKAFKFFLCVLCVLVLRAFDFDLRFDIKNIQYE